ncbi:MAG TPA: HNH endonuclease, partial [Nitrososphaera sp.]|jgi:hypothetical protein|nr:HNH endonuclease [Nitrososphaera sp.]HEX2615718.1 HNH endonuclease [Nitrososphaera sp.]
MEIRVLDIGQSEGISQTNWRIAKHVKRTEADRLRTCVLCHNEHLAFHRYAHSSFCPDCKTPALQKEERRYFAQLSRTERTGAPITLTLFQWIAILDHFDWKCAYCKGSFELMEHIISLSKGGGTTPDNVIPACAKCNMHKDRREALYTKDVTSLDVARVQSKLKELWLI